MRTLSRKELTAALAARQYLLERARVAPAEAIRSLTPLQAQDPPAAFVALAARLEGFSRDALEAAIEARQPLRLLQQGCPSPQRPTPAQHRRSWRRPLP